MDWVEFAAQWLHIFFGIFWFGTVLFADFVLVPAIMTLPGDRQAEFINVVSARADRIIPFVATATIVLGILRGTLIGPIKDVAGLTTDYGLSWLVGLVAAVATFAWGYLGSQRRARFAQESAQFAGAGGELPPELAAQRDRIRVEALVELAGFLVVFTTMIFMHFASGG